MRYARRGALAVCAVVVAYWIVLPVGMAIVGTHRPRQPETRIELGRPYERVTIRTRDGLRLAAAYVPSRNGAAVIAYPTRQGKPCHARLLARHGYGVLLLDARGYDGSEGTANLFGWSGTQDIDAAVAWLRQRREVSDERVGGIGFSVGGEVMLDAAAANAGLRAVVSEGAGIRSVREAALYGVRGWPSLPTYAVETMALAVLSGSSPPRSLRDAAARITPRAVFFIYAEHGSGGEDLNPNLYEAASEPKQIWRVPGASHTGGYEADPVGYERRVIAFFDRTLLREATPPAGS
jgi:dienelactone hydrolase